MNKRCRILTYGLISILLFTGVFLYPVLADDSAPTGKPITLTINWLEDTLEERPESIKIELYRTVDDQEVPMDSKIITEADAISENTWQITFEYYYGLVWEYAFKINECEPPTALYSYQLIESGNGTDHYTFDFVYGHGSTVMTIQTVWDDNNNSAGLRPDSVTVELYSLSEDQTEPERKLILSGSDTAKSWTATVEGLKEDPANYYITLKGLPDNYKSLITRGSEDSTYIATNTLVSEQVTEEKAGPDSPQAVADTIAGIANTVNVDRVTGKGILSKLWIPFLIILILVGIPTLFVYYRKNRNLK